jgi:predicted ester cyclase
VEQLIGHRPIVPAAIMRAMTEDALAFYRRYNACCNEHRFSDLRAFVAHDVAVNGVEIGPDVYAQNLQTVIDGFPDFRWELRRVVSDPPWIAVHLTDTGTHRGSFYGVAATGRSVTTEEFAFYRVEAGRIREVWGMAFHLPLLEQVG